MTEQVIYRAPGEGGTRLVGGGDYLTTKLAGAEVGDEMCVWEVTTTPHFGPPLHTHDWAEFFYVLDGEYTFSRIVDGQEERLAAPSGTAVGIPPSVPHTFNNYSDRPARMLIVHAPAGLESFFEVYGVPVEKVGDPLPTGAEPPDPALMGEILPAHGVHLVGTPTHA
jgi:quercetin dioxygenase-like cupin family protein